MIVQDIYNIIDRFAPFATASSWDNAGMLVGDLYSDVTGVLLALDATPQVIAQAVEKGFNLIVTHHPIIFSPIKSIIAGTNVYKLLTNQLSIICAHTNLDLAEGGVQTVLANALGLENHRVLSLSDGYGLVGDLNSPLSPKEFATVIKNALGITPRYNPVGATSISSVGLCSGSAGEMAVQCKRDFGHDYTAFVTGDVKHSHFLEAAAAGITLYDAGHNGTEHLVMPMLCELLQKETDNSVPIEMATVYAGELIE